MPRISAPMGSRLRARIRARDVIIATQRPVGLSALNVLHGVVVAVVPGSGADAMVEIDCSGDRLFARVTRHSVQSLELASGRPIFAIVKAATFDQDNAPGPAPHRR